MSVPANGADAKDIALHFIDMTTGKVTPSIMAKTVTQAKNLLNYGYNKTEIIDVIDYLITVKHVDLYSLGYVNASINNVLREIQKQKANQKKPIPPTFTQTYRKRNEVKENDESTNRNKSKLNRFGIQPRFGEESFIDMFKR